MLEKQAFDSQLRGESESDSSVSNQKPQVSLVIDAVLLKWLVWLLPIAMLSGLLLIRYLDKRLYTAFLYEDSVAEWVSALCYLASTIVAVRLALCFRRIGSRWLSFCYCVIALAMFMILGEEISWGQRILDIASPAYFLEASSQQEINIHNLQPVQKWLHTVYITIGMLGAFLWIPRSFSPGSGWILNHQLIPGWYLMSYFLPTLLFYTYYETFYRVHDVIGLIPRDQEPAELVLALGFLAFIYRTWLTVSLPSDNRWLAIRLVGKPSVSQTSLLTPQQAPREKFATSHRHDGLQDAWGTFSSRQHSASSRRHSSPLHAFGSVDRVE